MHGIYSWQVATACLHAHAAASVATGMVMNGLCNMSSRESCPRKQEAVGSKLQLQSAWVHTCPYIALPLQCCKRLLKHHYPYAAISNRLCRFAHDCMSSHTSVRGALSLPINAAKGSESMEDPKPRPLRLLPTLVCNQIRPCTADNRQCALVCML